VRSSLENPEGNRGLVARTSADNRASKPRTGKNVFSAILEVQMSDYGWVGKHTDELLRAVGMINHAASLLSSDDRAAQRDAVKLLHMAVDESVVKAAALEWQPMKTAPKDGEAIILLTAERLPVIAFWAEWETGGDADNNDPPEWDSGWCLNGCQTVVLIGKMIAWARLSLPDKFNSSEAETDVKSTTGESL